MQKRRDMTMTRLQVYQILNSRIGERETEAFITYIDTTLKDNRDELVESIQRSFASKEDLANVKGQLEVKLEVVKGQLEVKISDVRTDVIRWMFAFFVTMLLAILGLYFKK
jgi:hypothetical protein